MASSRIPPLVPVLAALAFATGGCMLQGDRNVTAAAPDAPAGASGMASPPGVRTVRRAAADTDATAPVNGTPSPRQIFDFHPAGSRADAWRQPFIIDPNDGPLAADVRRSAAELRAYLAAPKADLKTANARRCSETDVATRKLGCVGGSASAVAGRSGAETP